MPRPGRRRQRLHEAPDGAARAEHDAHGEDEARAADDVVVHEDGAPMLAAAHDAYGEDDALAAGPAVRRYDASRSDDGSVSRRRRKTAGQ